MNAISEADDYPLPNVCHFTHKLKGSTHFSKVDLVKAFHQIRIRKQDQMKTAVKTPWGVYFFKRLAMGLASSAQSFQRLFDNIMEGLEGVFVYLDDIMVHVDSKETHDTILEEVFKRLEEAGLAISLDKCSFGKTSINYLGYQVDSRGIRPLARKIEAIKYLPPPTSHQTEGPAPLSRGPELFQIKSEAPEGPKWPQIRSRSDGTTIFTGHLQYSEEDNL